MFTDEARREFIKRFEEFPDQVIAMAWAYAVGLTKFDVDLSKEWATVTDCANYVEGDICHICEFIPKQKTNADRIRSMTDEELAEWLWFKAWKMTNERAAKFILNIINAAEAD